MSGWNTNNKFLLHAGMLETRSIYSNRTVSLMIVLLELLTALLVGIPDRFLNFGKMGFLYAQ